MQARDTKPRARGPLHSEWDPFTDSETEATELGAGNDSEDTSDEPCAGGLCTPVVDLRPSVVVRLASNGKWDAVLRALGTGRYPVNAPWDCNATVLHHAAWAGNAHVVAAALALGADPDSRDEDCRTTLHYACEGSDDGVRACVLRAHGSPGACSLQWLELELASNA